ncbi:hypothetical protein [Pseudoalteromonas xiamenensis]|uniref:Uncharacterized protein n=1 Tax=Pseudoalteromonas xiamenensis TaxID=882626 RepID=A0A975DKT9_9GAMM|nr:hypothetical protein [Pseudoalteromonas xiamenensis]QTH73484.1 hypothetical protein J5O05_18500 [Pseudoalteromonas xiamenensis]
MKKLVSILLVVVAMFASKPTLANEALAKLFIQSQGFTEQQETLALNVFNAFKAVTDEVKSSKGSIKLFFIDAATSEQLDANAAYESYKQWQTNVDIRVLHLLESMSQLHAELTPEQKQAFMAKLIKASKKDD